MNKLTPKDYYYNYFRDDFIKFIDKSRVHYTDSNNAIFIPIQELNNENLEHIVGRNRMLFIYSLTFTVLIDMVMYTYFKNDYIKFQEMTNYPKVEWGLTATKVNPWSIAKKAGGMTTFEKFSEFFIDDLKDFFSLNKFDQANWQTVKESMLTDSEVAFGKFGKIFESKLKKID